MSSELTTVLPQKTLQKETRFSGVGIHTGVEVNMHFVPAPVGTGIIFRRTDTERLTEIPATLEYVCDTSRSTTIGVDALKIHTIEHVLAAIKAFEIDNLYIDISSIEPPIGNGSSDVFVNMIEEVGVIEQEGLKQIVKVTEPIYWSEDDIHIVALPYDGYKISYTLNYPESPVLDSQYYSTIITPETFKQQLSSCRTFSLYEEISALMDHGLIKGGSLDNAVVIKDDVILSKDGLFFPNEMVRHKILDMVGDLSLVPFNFHAHIISIRSGHRTNILFAKKLYHAIKTESH